MTNLTPFAAQELYLADPEGRDLLVVVVKATYDIRAGRALSVAEEQVPVDVAGTYYGDPATTAIRYEPEIAPFKVATDVVLVGHAYSPGAPQVDVGLQVGPVSRVVRVFGDRVWTSSLGFLGPSNPVPFETMPITYDRAFGGWDTSPEDDAKHTVEARNPVGVGFHPSRHSVFEEGSPLPNVEDPRSLIRSFQDTPAPAGFGFTGPSWMPRASFGGTYDDTWVAERMPVLPEDFDPRFYNAASVGLIAPGLLRGDENVAIVNASPDGRLQFALPGEPPPRCTVASRTGGEEELEMELDTVILDTDASQTYLLWRGRTLIPDGPHSIAEITIAPAATAAASIHAVPAFAY